MKMKARAFRLRSGYPCWGQDAEKALDWTADHTAGESGVELIVAQPGTWARVRRLVRELRNSDPSSMWPGALEALDKLEGWL